MYWASFIGQRWASLGLELFYVRRTIYYGPRSRSFGGLARISFSILRSYTSQWAVLRDPKRRAMQAAKEGEFVGARLETGLRVACFASPPSAEEFAADVEPKNVPAVTHRPPASFPSAPHLLLSVIDVFPCGIPAGVPWRGRGVERLLPVGSSPWRPRLFAGFSTAPFYLSIA
jgi:hypothetical protein